MGSLEGQIKMLRMDEKVIRSDFMIGNGKGHAKDSLTRQMPGMSKELTINDLESLYKSNSMAKNIVDIPSEDLTKSGWTLKMKDEKLKALYESKMRQLKAKDRFQKLFMFERLYGDGFISIGTVENKNFILADELVPENLKRIPYLNAFSSKKVSNRIVNEDMFSAEYGQIESFEINRTQRQGILLLDDMLNNKIHRSRVMHQQDLRFEDEIEGTSLLENLYDILTVVDTSLWSVGQILYDYVFKVMKSADVANMSQEQRVLVATAADYKFRTEALAIIDEKEELLKVSTPTSGIGELLDFVWDYLSGASRIPKTVLKGQESGTVTGAQYDVMNYYSRITAMQENQLRPHLEYLIRLLMMAEDECGGRINPDEVEWSIEFNPLWNVDAETDAKIRKLTAETDAIYITNGVIGPDEVKESRFGRFGVTETSKFNADGLSDEEIEAMSKVVYERYKEDRL